VRAGQLPTLRAWLGALGKRQDEVRATFRNEGVHHEQAYLIESADGPVLVYAIEVEDSDAANAAYTNSTLPIDLEHGAVMRATLEPERASAELLYDVRL
jgi:hypothetical protein